MCITVVLDLGINISFIIKTKEQRKVDQLGPNHTAASDHRSSYRNTEICVSLSNRPRRGGGVRGDEGSPSPGARTSMDEFAGDKRLPILREQGRR